MKLYCIEHNQVLQDIKKEFETVSNIEDADKIILWNDILPVERGIISYAHALGKKVLVMQHGRKGTSEYYPPFNEKIQADKLLVWGEFDRRELQEAGQEEKRIAVVGSPIFTHLKERKKEKGKTNIVFCPEHWDKPVDENRRVRNKLRRLGGKVQIKTKIIDVHDPKDFDNPVYSHRDDKNHLDVCVDILTTADLVVCVAEGTFELLAQAMDIPVVAMTDWTPKTFRGEIKHKDARRVYSVGCKQTSIKNLIKTIKQQLENPDELTEERKFVCINEGGINLDTRELVKKEILGL